MNKLKPCPFCGESKHITFKKDSIPDGQCHYFHVYYVDLYWCDNCGAEWQSDKYR